MRLSRVLSILAALGVLAATATVGTTPVSGQQAIQTDVVFLIDGSGSINAADWQVQTEGIARAIEDRSLFPVDGSVAITVVQWSSTTRIELDRWILTSPDRQTEASSVIRQLEQLGGGTSPHLGINAARNAFVGALDPALDQVLCLSTDGSPSSASALSSAASAAEADGFDRLSVVAIEDPPFFDAGDAENSYGPVVFGDGTVTIARDALEFSTLIGAACLNPPMELVALEVNQSVQSWNLDIPLVEGRKAVVRAFVQTTDGASATTPAQLFGTKNGTNLAQSPLAPSNRNGRVAVADDVTSRRADRAASLNFEVPGSWMQDDVRLRLELPGGVICNEAAPPANTCEVEVSTTSTDTFTLRPIAISYDNGLGEQAPSDAELEEQGLRVLSQFPIDSLNIDPGDFGEVLTGAPDVGDLLPRLRDMRDDECAVGSCDEDAIWYGVLTGGSGGGVAYRPGNVGVGYIGNGQGGFTGQGYARNRGPHEVAHSLGRPHTVDGDLGLINQTLWIFGGDKQGYCGEESSRDTPDYPHIAELNGINVPVLGPLGDDGTEIWGFDHRFLTGNEPLAVSDPRETLPLLSYGNKDECSIASSGQYRWISKHNYEALIDRLETGSGGASNDDPAGDSWEALFISGTIDFASETVAFRNARLLPSGRVEFAATGDYTIDVYDPSDVLIDSVAFEPDLFHGDWPESFTVRGSFNVPVQLPPGPIGRVAVRYTDTILGELVASPSTPVVSFLSPLQGNTLSDDEVVVSWEGSDPDDDELTYSLFYSSDGQSWRGLVHNTAAEAVTIDKDQLAASANGTFLVIVSDGINSSRDEVNFVTVANTVPEVTIVSPNDGDIFSGVQPIFLEALTFDREDGPLDGGAVVWASNVDGPLGSGTQVLSQAGDLSEGMHVITATVTDAAGSQATASVQIDIQRFVSPMLSLRQRLADLADQMDASGLVDAEAAADELRAVVDNDSLWADGNTLESNGETVYKAMRAAAFDLRRLDQDTNPALLEEASTVLLEVSATLASDAVGSAIDLSPQKGAKAQRELDRAETHAATGTLAKAVDEYRKAWKTAQ